jgi:hypothetical protein
MELAGAGICVLTSDIYLLVPMRDANRPPLRKLLSVQDISKHDFVHDLMPFLGRQGRSMHVHIDQRLTADVNVQRTVIS